jgi:nicotinamidase/pyrazinamidase
MGDQARSALLLIDVQIDFCPGGALPVPNGDRIVPVLNRYLGDAVSRGMRVYASRDWHPAVTSHFKPYGGEWPPHGVQHTPGARFHPHLQLPPSTIVVSKGDDPRRPGYSAFDGRTVEGSPLVDDLRQRGIDRLYVGGLATDYCVRASVLDARRAGFEVTLLGDAVAGIDVHAGDSDRAIADMREAGAAVSTVAEWAFAIEVGSPIRGS